MRNSSTDRPQVPGTIHWLKSNWLRVMVHTTALALFAWLIYGYFARTLGVNPVQYIVQTTGDNGIKFLMCALACTPLTTLTGFKQFGKVRRALGLYGFFFILSHFLSFAVLDFRLDLELIVQEITQKPYILVGLTALILLTPLAITSTKGWIKRLGKRWKRLHQIFYFIIMLGILHFWWSQKAQVNQGLTLYLPLALLMLAVRIPAIRRWIVQLRTARGSAAKGTLAASTIRPGAPK